MFIVALDYMEHTSIKYYEDMQPLNSANVLTNHALKENR